MLELALSYWKSTTLNPYNISILKTLDNTTTKLEEGNRVLSFMKKKNIIIISSRRNSCLDINFTVPKFLFKRQWCYPWKSSMYSKHVIKLAVTVDIAIWFCNLCTFFHVITIYRATRVHYKPCSGNGSYWLSFLPRIGHSMSQPQSILIVLRFCVKQIPK